MTDKNNTKTVRVKDKIKAIYPHIVVGGKIDKPCFSIHWYDVKKKEMYIGYSSYNLNYVREWLKENFEIVEPEIDNLLKRQKTEIERLKSMNQAKLDCIHDLQNENEILSRNADTAFQDGLNERRDLFAPEIKAEAIKEFAKRLKSSIYINTNLLDYQCEAVEIVIDDIVKEMVGETNDT